MTQGSPQSIILIPAYNPGTPLLNLVGDLLQHTDLQVLIVNDGSTDPASVQVFVSIAAMERVTILRHAVNLGKGHALKTGIHAVLLGEYPSDQPPLLVTADADGQHSAADILAVLEKCRIGRDDLVLGVRRFDGPVPLRSRMGNLLTSVVVRIMAGISLRDTQTGLRAIPPALRIPILKLPGRRYELELEMLLEAHRLHIPVSTVAISTIYEAGNSGSHFNPVLDSLRVYLVFVRYCASSLMTFALDTVVFILVWNLTPSVVAATAAARIAAGSVNFCLNKWLVFQSQGRSVAFEALKYALLVALLGSVSIAVMKGLSGLGTPVIAAKILAESLLFFAGFILQRTLVFGGRTRFDLEPADDRS